MTRPFRTERPEPPRHAHISKLLRYSFSLKGRRKMLALDSRIRRKARCLGLTAKHHRVIGGWSAIDEQTGSTVIERCFDYELEEYLNKKAAAICTGSCSLNNLTTQIEKVTNHV